MTDYQKAQLLHLHCTGDFKYRNSKGNKVPRKAWVLMIDTLTGNGFIDDGTCAITPKGIMFCNENHLDISLSVLD